MSVIESFFVALALAMDCFTVSISCGVIQRCMGAQVWGMAFMFGFFQAMMALLGWAAADVFSNRIEAYDHWLAFGLLLLIGGKMIWDGAFPKDHPSCNPSKFLVLLILSFATSIDAMAVGCSFVGMGLFRGEEVVLPIVLIGITSFILTFIGKSIGVRIGHKFDWPTEEIGGMILIIIGCKVLIQHLNM